MGSREGLWGRCWNSSSRRFGNLYQYRDAAGVSQLGTDGKSRRRRWNSVAVSMSSWSNSFCPEAGACWLEMTGKENTSVPPLKAGRLRSTITPWPWQCSVHFSDIRGEVVNPIGAMWDKGRGTGFGETTPGILCSVWTSVWKEDERRGRQWERSIWKEQSWHWRSALG